MAHLEPRNFSRSSQLTRLESGVSSGVSISSCWEPLEVTTYGLGVGTLVSLGVLAMVMMMAAALVSTITLGGSGVPSLWTMMSADFGR